MNPNNSRGTMVIAGVIACLLLALGVSTVISRAANPATGSPAFLHVKPTASGSGNCSNWDNACTLQTALADPGTGDEIWVMTGVYTPTTTGTDRTATFQLKSGVAVYGGFVGTESSLEDRDWRANITVLSGDIDNNDITDPSGVITTTSNIDGSNSYHVVTGSGTDAMAILDGFTVTGGNASGSYPLGGGMINFEGSPTVTNVTFSGNNASYGGGGMSNQYSSPTLTKVIFTANTAFLGGGIHNESSSPTVTNVAFSGNGAYDGGGMGNDQSSSPTLTNVTFSRNHASYGGGMCNFLSSTTLANSILWGNTASSGDQIALDASSSATISYGLIQEVECPARATCDGHTIYNEDPQFVDADGFDNTPGTLDDDLSLELSSPAIDAGDNGAVPVTVTLDLGGRPRFADVSGVPDTGSGTPPVVDLGAYEAPPERVYVDQEASGDNDGSSWADALTDLQDGLTWAVDGVEIWVAEGTYKPGAERTDSFQLKSGVEVYGGFEGDETALDQRNWTVHETILSGDIGEPDDPSDNSYHVVTGSGVDATAILDGFTVTGGNADSDWPYSHGGGIFSDGGSPTVANVTFSGNSANLGAGMNNHQDSNPTLIDVAFSGNHASDSGGGMNNYLSNPTLTNVAFSDNSAGVGGGVHNYSSSPTLANVTFNGNQASENGGGMHNYNSSPTLANVTFSGNTATSYGGGMNTYSSSPTLVNVTFSDNSAGYGGGMCNHQSSVVTAANCILVRNAASSGGNQIHNLTGSSCNVTYSDVQGGYSGTGNINADPLFVRNPDPGDGDWTTPDNNDYGDLRLQLTSPAIDAGNNNLPKDTCDLDGDGDTDEPLPLDLEGLCRCVDIPDRPDTGVGPDRIVDMGAYEARLHVYLPLVLKNYAP